MKTKSLINAFKKAGLRAGKVPRNERKYAVEGKEICTWFDSEGEASCIHVTSNRETSDLMTDYFPGTFAHSMKQAVAWTIGK